MNEIKEQSKEKHTGLSVNESVPRKYTEKNKGLIIEN